MSVLQHFWFGIQEALKEGRTKGWCQLAGSQGSLGDGTGVQGLWVLMVVGVRRRADWLRTHEVAKIALYRQRRHGVQGLLPSGTKAAPCRTDAQKDRHRLQGWAGGTEPRHTRQGIWTSWGSSVEGDRP